MKTCNYCQRPQYGGFYRTNSNKIFCYDCYMRMKERALDEQERIKQEASMHGREWLKANQRIAELEKQIKAQGYDVWWSDYEKQYRVNNGAPFYIMQLVSQLNEVYSNGQMHYSTGMNLKKNSMYADIFNATYCESENDEKKKFGNVI